MYAFLVLGLPLGFVLLDLVVYPREELIATKRAFFRGLISFIPICVASRALGSLVPELPGTIWSSLHEWADRILPYSLLPAATYLIFYRYGERLPAGTAERRLTSFYAGALTPAGLVEMIRIWGAPDPYGIFLLPLLFAAMTLLMPPLVFALRNSYGWELAGRIAALAIGTLAISFLPLLFLLGLWPLAWIVAAGAAWLGWVFAVPGLSRRPPPQSE